MPNATNAVGKPPKRSGGWVEGSLLRPQDSGLGVFVGRAGSHVFEDVDGGVKTAPASKTRWPWLWELHLRGKRRVGIFVALPGGRCRVAIWDLDAHTAGAASRHADACRLVATLGDEGIVAYWIPSRGGRGAHVWMFFDEPGVLAPDLRVFMAEIASALHPCDVFPSGRRDGGAVMLPYFGGQAPMDADCRPVGREHLESNPVEVIPTSSVTAPSWPPSYWRGTACSTAKGAELKELLAEGSAAGLLFELDGSIQARQGWRNRIAGSVARSLLRGGGSFEDFKRWDSRNLPPLASDEPASLRRWWRWAQNSTDRQRRQA